MNEDENRLEQFTDFMIKLYRGAVIPKEHPNFNNHRVEIEIFSSKLEEIETSKIQIEGKDYYIKSQNLLNKIKDFINKNLDTLINWSLHQNNFNLDNNAYEGGMSRTIRIKYGQLIINVNGQVRDIGDLCDEFINEIVSFIVNEGNKTDADYISDTMFNLSNETQNDEDKEFEKYCKLYEEKFGKRVYIAEPYGSKTETIEAIKKCLDEDRDILDSLLTQEDNMRFININNKIRGSLIGGAIGDALGYQIEFKRGIKDKEITKFMNTPAIISDDTQMTLFTANGLIWRETRGAMRGIAMTPPDAVYEAYLDWLDTQYSENRHNSISWIKSIKELNYQRAPGNTCIGALSSRIKGTIEKPINNSKGCGGIMRVAPVGLYMNNSEIAGKYGADIGAITHGHPLGIIPCYVLSTLIYFLVNENISIRDALNKALKQYEEKFDIFDQEYKEYFLQLTKKAIELSEKNISDVEAIKELGEGWVAEETFAIAIYACLKYSMNFEDAIICSINHDGDSDSTGSVAGNIIGASLGYTNIPEYYKDNIELKDIILEIADDLSVNIPVSEYSNNNDKKWLDKYSYCKK